MQVNSTTKKQNLASRQRYAKPGGKVDPEQPKSTPQSLMVLYAALAETFSGIQSRRHPNRAKNRTSKGSYAVHTRLQPDSAHEVSTSNAIDSYIHMAPSFYRNAVERHVLIGTVMIARQMALGFMHSCIAYTSKEIDHESTGR
ncbi:uncharacterized protein UDID_18559 [Ustilago sp. UG-2017a]|nr:uncharacterized protein UDID_18559 [Ustilago sp. UG-2017a]